MWAPGVDNRARGRRGEALAAAYLEEKGCVVLARNYRALGCEVDVIAQDGETLVFAEVKARAGLAYGLGREAVGPGKQAHILRAAQSYLQENGGFERLCRFDVLEVDLRTGRVAWIQNAFGL